MHTSINLLKLCSSCAPGYRRLCTTLQKFEWPKDDDHPIPIWMFVLSGDEDLGDLGWVIDNSCKIDRDEFRQFYEETYHFVYVRRLVQLLDQTAYLALDTDTGRDLGVLKDIGTMLGLPLTEPLGELGGKAKKRTVASKIRDSYTRSTYQTKVLESVTLELPSVATLTERLERARSYSIGRGRANEIMEHLQSMSANEPIRYLRSFKELAEETPVMGGNIATLLEVLREEDDEVDEDMTISPHTDEASIAKKAPKIVGTRHPLIRDNLHYYSRDWRNLSARERLLRLWRVDEKLKLLTFKNENRKGSTVKVTRTSDGAFQTASFTVTNPSHVLRIQEIIGTKLEKTVESALPSNVVAIS